MNPLIGWTLAALAIAIGYARFGWQGALFGITVVAFWLLLNFNRTLRVLRKAGQAPVGYVDSAVMLNSKLQPGLRLLDVIGLTRSLGQRVSQQPEVWRWTDPGASAVEVTVENGRVVRWALQRPPESHPEGAA